MTVSSVPGPVLLHLHRHVEHLERAGRVQPSMTTPKICGFMSSISHSIDRRPARCRGVGRRPARPGRAARSASPDRRARRRRSRRARSLIAGTGPNDVGVRRHDQRAGRRHQLLLHGARSRRARSPSSLHRRRRRHRETGRAPTATMPPPTLSGEQTMRSAPNHSSAEDDADDVDDRVERADFVQVHLLDRHLVDRGLGLGQPLEHALCARSRPAGRQRGLVDERRDLGEGSVRMRVLGDGCSCWSCWVPCVRAVPGCWCWAPVPRARARVNFVADTPARRTRVGADVVARRRRGCRARASARRAADPASSSAPSTMSPEMPEKQSK